MLTVKKKLWPVFFVLVIIAMASCGGGGYQFQPPIKRTPPAPVTKQRTFTVEPGQAKVIFVSVNAGDRLTGSFTVEGGSGDDINFCVKDPWGNLVLKQGRVSNRWRFAFMCASTGSYQLNFDNGFSIFSNKVVNLTTTLYRKG